MLLDGGPEAYYKAAAAAIPSAPDLVQIGRMVRARTCPWYTICRASVTECVMHPPPSRAYVLTCYRASRLQTTTLQWYSVFAQTNVLEEIHRLRVVVSTRMVPKAGKGGGGASGEGKVKGGPKAPRARSLVVEAPLHVDRVSALESFLPLQGARADAAAAAAEAAGTDAVELRELPMNTVATAPLSEGDEGGEETAVPGSLVVGVWKGTGTVAFVWCVLHHHGLLHRALDGDEHTLGRGPPLPPPPTGAGAAAGEDGDVDPLRGLHDYTLTVELDALGVEGGAGRSNAIFSGSFPHLDLVADRVPQVIERNGTRYFKCAALKQDEQHKHLPFDGAPALAWSAGPMNGVIRNAVMVEATLLDEHGEVFWAAATPSALADAPPETVDFAYAGNWSSFSAGLGNASGGASDGDGDGGDGRRERQRNNAAAVVGTFVHDTDADRYYLTHLELLIKVDAVNERFRTAY